MKRLRNLESSTGAHSALSIWTVYHAARDVKERYCARRFVVSDGFESFTDELLVSDRIEEIRAELYRRGLVRLDRMEDDEPHIVEVWL